MYNKRKYKTLDQLAALDHIGTIFTLVKKKHKGKVLYLDFWGTWCKPCLREFPLSKSLYKELENKNIEFIYFCSLSEEKAWQETKDKYQLAGMHFLLNTEQHSVMAGLFNISSLPRYMVVNKEGIIIAENAGRPGEKETRTLLLQLAGQ